MVTFNPGLSQTLGTFFLPKNIVEPSLRRCGGNIEACEDSWDGTKKFFFSLAQLPTRLAYNDNIQTLISAIPVQRSNQLS